ncbi:MULTISPECIES: hypothetical protein [Streptomyces]|uniref:Uncharacterized protein n=1 Tax=Streptomyces dengpaensis TaxID=2049881 RepID=A0ABM6SVA3_9ACTN|nr:MULTISPECIES: hypothetical protein [Streptomyces]AVH58461.1 hypothetical protein C4B68_24815 [Streptomyces dengpaensis]PIB06132.1 hypothetical protein B1C81_26520 [Streptomyces sp. HG99]
MSAPTFLLDDSVNDPEAELWFAEPAGFTALPLDALLPEPGSPAADQLRTAVAPFLDAAADEMARQQFIAQFASAQQLMSALREVGTVHCSIGLHRDDVDESGASGGQPLLSFFTVSWRETAVAPRGVTAARAVTGTEGHTHTEYRELPCGPATFSETVRTPSADSGLPTAPLLQVYAYLPHPDCKRLALLTLSTTAMARRAEYRTILRQIADTVSFDNPLDADSSKAP